MRPRLPWILLAISLVANLFFVAGAFYAYSHYGNEDRGRWKRMSTEEIVETLDLTAAQREGLAELRRRASERRESVRGGFRRMREALVEQLRAPEFDRDGYAALLAESSEDRRAYFVDMAEALHGYVGTLSPEQRETFFELAEQRGFLFSVLRDRDKDRRDRDRNDDD